MHRKYLGDSYDALKRLWKTIFDDWAPLYAYPRFIPDDLWDDYTRMTGISKHIEGVWDQRSILNDPHTGIHLPDSTKQKETISHIPLARIIDQLTDKSIRCVLTYDQSYRRRSDISVDAQREAKMNVLRESEVSCFYYASHVSFLFAFSDRKTCSEMRTRLDEHGIPKTKILG